MTILTKRNGSAVVTDGAGNTYTFADVGDVTLGPLEEGKAPAIPVMERGQIADWVLGDEEEISGSFSVNLRAAQFLGTGQDQPIAVVLKLGTWTSATSTLTGGVTGDPFMVKLELKWVKGGLTSEVEVNPCRLRVDSIDESGETLRASISFHGARSSVT